MFLDTPRTESDDENTNKSEPPKKDDKRKREELLSISTIDDAKTLQIQFLETRIDEMQRILDMYILKTNRNFKKLKTTIEKNNIYKIFFFLNIQNYEIMKFVFLLVVFIIWIALIVRYRPQECEAYIPEWYFSKSRQRYIYGGFTADIGWVLMVARYSYSLGKEFAFTEHWGHGSIGGSWTEMFVQKSKCTNKRRLEGKTNQKLRQEIKFKDYYTMRSYKVHPNKLIQKKFNMRNVSPLDDLTTMRRLFKDIFKLNRKSRLKVNKLKNSISPKKLYIGVHVRWGDKIGNGNKNDPVESSMIPLETYVRIIKKIDLKTIFVATDDYIAVVELRELLPNYTIFTSSDPVQHTGFSISAYKPDLQGTIKLWADMEVLSEAQYFIGNFESNVARTVHLMRVRESFDIMDYHRGNDQRKCCENKYNNCFWFCNF